MHTKARRPSLLQATRELDSVVQRESELEKELEQAQVSSGEVLFQ